MNNLNQRVLRFLYFYPNSKAKDIAKALRIDKRTINQILYKQLKEVADKNDHYQWSISCALTKKKIAQLSADRINSVQPSARKQLEKTNEQLHAHFQRWTNRKNDIIALINSVRRSQEVRFPTNYNDSLPAWKFCINQYNAGSMGLSDFVK